VYAVKFKWLLLILIVIVFSGGRVAMAQEGNPKNSTTSNGGSEQMEGMDMSGNHDMKGMDMRGDKNKDSHEMEGTDKSSDHKKDSHDDMEGMDMGHGPVVEKPANLKVLGTYGAVNLSFIVIGVWNKWCRRKGDLDGNSK
jgi:hypothetical protein